MEVTITALASMTGVAGAWSVIIFSNCIPSKRALVSPQVKQDIRVFRNHSRRVDFGGLEIVELHPLACAFSKQNTKTHILIL
jgi:hypothetical protein